MVSKLKAFALAGGAVVASMAYSGATTPASGWGDVGHRIIAGAALGHLPEGLPPFLYDPRTARNISNLAIQPDLDRGKAGDPHNWRAQGHYINLQDDGTLAGARPLTKETSTIGDFERSVQKGGGSIFAQNGGFLPYNLIDGYQKLVMHFAQWRVLSAMIDHPDLSMDDKTDARSLRETRIISIIQDIGIWSHFVGDASNPLHLTIHYNGWSSPHNPNGYSTSPKIHWQMEGIAVEQLIRAEDVARLVTPYTFSNNFDIRTDISGYLETSHSLVETVYQLDKRGAFATDGKTPLTPPLREGQDFLQKRLAAGATKLRDLIATAWQESEQASLGFGIPVPVRELIKNPRLVRRDMVGTTPPGLK